MIPSIRRFLLFNLLLSVTITSSITAVGNYYLDNSDIQYHLDAQLKQTTFFLNSILTEDHTSNRKMQELQQALNVNRKALKKETENKDSSATSRLQFQISNDANRIILYSSHSSKALFTTQDGFSNLHLNSQSWRLYSLYNNTLHLRVTTAELYDFRQELEERITWDNLLIILWTYPLLGLLIWLTVGHGLKSLDRLAQQLAMRRETDFSPLSLEGIPVEVRVLIDELNHLFFRLQQTFDRNKRFASDAAHELRTPLAALKAQTQLLMLASSDQERELMLKNLLKSVNRATHVVQQLLTLSRLGAKDILEDMNPVDLTRMAAEMLAELAPLALNKNIDIELLEPDTRAKIRANETALNILIRNLVDNAIRYTPEGESVRVRVCHNPQKHEVKLQVTDTGPGISPELHSRVFERFFRVLGTKESGSGLGLAIVQQIAELHHAKIELHTPENNKGLQVDVIFPDQEHYDLWYGSKKLAQ